MRSNHSLFLSALFAVCFCIPLASCNSSATHDHDGGARDASVVDAGHDAGPPVACTSDGDCDDSLYCDGIETCRDKVCVPGKTVVCDDGIACTKDACSEAQHECRALPPDADGDGHYDSACTDEKGKALGDDCDDADGHRFPGNIETCDATNHDEDCDPHTVGDKDSDGDGFIDAKCCNPSSDKKGAKLHCGDDCDDLKKNVSPMATEACDGFDNDCDGVTDEGVTRMMYPDRDFDGHGAAKVDASWDCKGVKKEYLDLKPKLVCAGEKGYATTSDDCNDCDPDINPSQLEICDGKDNDCVGGVDDKHEEALWYPDVDGDNFGDMHASGLAIVKSCDPVKNHVLRATDCDDNDAALNPAADEVCDGKDNDCRNGADYQLGVNDFEDDDADHHADKNCGGAADDCNDEDPTTAAGNDEICDGRDNDCDGAVDENVASTVWYVDHDGDGYGDDAAPQEAYCGTLPGRTSRPGDCNDQDATVHPGAVELCDNINQDCDAQTDETPAESRCSLAHADPYCARGKCRVDLCKPGFRDCDDNPANGCETVGTSCGGGGAGSGGAGTGGTIVPILPVDCLGGTQHTGDVTITTTGDFVTLKGVACLQGNLFVSNSTTIVDLSPLASLQFISGTLQINSNSALTSLAGLSNLTTVGVTLNISSNQALKNVDALSGLTTVGGNFVISSNGALLQLDGFSSLSLIAGSADVSYNNGLYSALFPALQKVGGNLTITSDPALLSLAGFGMLDSVGGYLQIISDNSLGDVAGFNALTAVGSTLFIYSNASLANVTGFLGLAGVGLDLTIHDNPVLTALDGLGSLDHVNGAFSLYNDGLLGITGFAKLNKVNGSFQLYGDGALAHLAGFAGLTTLGSDFLIQGNPQLLDITGFAGLHVVTGKLTIDSNAALAAVSGMTGLQNVGDALRVTNNLLLSDISGLNAGAFVRLGNELRMAGNPSLSHCQVDVLKARLAAASVPFTGSDYSCCNLGCGTCSGAVCSFGVGGGGQSGDFLGDVAISDTSSMALLANVKKIIGNLTMNSTNLTTLGGLSGLQAVTGSVNINSDNFLASLAGLSGLTTVGGNLVIDSNPMLGSLSALSSLTSVGGRLELYNDGSLGSLAGLQSLVSVGGDLAVTYCPGITQMDDLTSLQSVGGRLQISEDNGLQHLDSWNALKTVGNGLEINYDNALTTIHGLPNLTTLAGDLNIENDPALTAVDGLAGLQGIVNGALRINSDAALSTLSGFANLQSIDGLVEIESNPGLSDITGFIKLASVQDSLTIAGDGLVHLTGFSALVHAFKDLVVAGNPQLLDVTGLAALSLVDGTLQITDNASLTHFNGIAKLDKVGADLLVARNSLLASLDGLTAAPLSKIGNNLVIVVNPLLSSCRVDVLFNQVSARAPGLSGQNRSAANSGCSMCSAKTCNVGNGTTSGQSGLYTGSINLNGATTTAADLALYRNVTDITGSVSINATPLTSLNGLDSLQHIGGNLVIDSNTSLTSVAALAKLVTIDGYFEFESENVIPNLIGLGQLTAIGGRLSIYYAAQLPNLDGLSHLTTIGGNLEIYQNGVNSVAGLTDTALGQLKTVGGNVNVQYNGALSDCAVMALTSALTTHGWASTLISNGNLACAKSCVNGICQ